MVQARIGFFKIKKCGYYRYGEQEPAFGQVSQLLQQISEWSNALSLARTKTYQPSEQLMPAYLYDLKRKDGDWLLTLWNETPASESGVASVQADGLVGDAEVHINEIVKGSIPGFPSYFWFVPEAGVFANLRFQYELAGHAQLQKYLTAFLERSSPHVAYAEETAAGVDAEILGYRENDDDEPFKFHPHFKSEVFTKPGQLDLLRNRVTDITRVHRRITLQLQTAEDLAGWQWLWRKIKGKEKARQTDDVSVSYDLKSPVSGAEFDDIISTAETDIENGWDDIGFDVKGFQTTQWLRKSYARDRIDVDVKWKNDEIVDGDSLLEQLNRLKPELMKLLES